MRPIQGKRLALWIVASGLLALAIAVVFLRDSLIEGYRIRMLGSRDPEIRFKAVDELARRKSVRAVPHLIRLLKDEPLERVEIDLGSLDNRTVRFTPILHAIYTIGEAGRSSLDAAIRDNEQIWHPGQYNISWLLIHVRRTWDTQGSVVEPMGYSVAGDNEHR